MNLSASVKLSPLTVMLGSMWGALGDGWWRTRVFLVEIARPKSVQAVANSSLLTFMS